MIYAYKVSDLDFLKNRNELIEVFFKNNFLDYFYIQEYKFIMKNYSNGYLLSSTCLPDIKTTYEEVSKIKSYYRINTWGFLLDEIGLSMAKLMFANIKVETL